MDRLDQLCGPWHALFFPANLLASCWCGTQSGCPRHEEVDTLHRCAKVTACTACVQMRSRAGGHPWSSSTVSGTLPAENLLIKADSMDCWCADEKKGRRSSLAQLNGLWRLVYSSNFAGGYGGLGGASSPFNLGQVSVLFNCPTTQLM